jgi:hypothetical protein
LHTIAKRLVIATFIWQAIFAIVCKRADEAVQIGKNHGQNSGSKIRRA